MTIKHRHRDFAALLGIHSLTSAGKPAYVIYWCRACGAVAVVGARSKSLPGNGDNWQGPDLLASNA